MPFDITILGSNSAIPAHGRHPSAQVIHHKNDYFLVDCGEGTQMRMSTFGIKRMRIEHIFISHLHGDHFFGLIGLITTYNLLKRIDDLHIYSHADLEKIIEQQLLLSQTKLVFKIHYHVIKLNSSEVIFENDNLTVSTFPLNHRIPCSAFIFKEKAGVRKILKAEIDKHNIDNKHLQAIKSGMDYVTNDGLKIPNNQLTVAGPAPRTYAYVSDTTPLAEIIPIVRQSDLLYHEATFRMIDTTRAAETYHSTTVQAATIAQQADVKKLLIGHFSAKHKSTDLPMLLQEAQAIFSPTFLAEEGVCFEI